MEECDPVQEQHCVSVALAEGLSASHTSLKTIIDERRPNTYCGHCPLVIGYEAAQQAIEGLPPPHSDGHRP